MLLQLPTSTNRPRRGWWSKCNTCASRYRRWAPDMCAVCVTSRSQVPPAMLPQIQAQWGPKLLNILHLLS